MYGFCFAFSFIRAVSLCLSAPPPQSITVFSYSLLGLVALLNLYPIFFFKHQQDWGPQGTKASCFEPVLTTCWLSQVPLNAFPPQLPRDEPQRISNLSGLFRIILWFTDFKTHSVKGFFHWPDLLLILEESFFFLPLFPACAGDQTQGLRHSLDHWATLRNLRNLFWVFENLPALLATEKPSHT